VFIPGISNCMLHSHGFIRLFDDEEIKAKVHAARSGELCYCLELQPSLHFWQARQPKCALPLLELLSTNNWSLSHLQSQYSMLCSYLMLMTLPTEIMHLTSKALLKTSGIPVFSVYRSISLISVTQPLQSICQAVSWTHHVGWHLS
jgi:hypothetical protein